MNRTHTFLLPRWIIMAAVIGAIGAMIQASGQEQQFGGSMQQAANAVQSQMLIVVATHDFAVTPEASHEFAKFAGADLIEFDSDGGHQFFVSGCEGKDVRQAVREFLR